MSLTDISNEEIFITRIVSHIKHFLESTNNHIDLTIEKFVFQESQFIGGILDIGYRGYTLEDLEKDSESINARNNYITLYLNDSGELDLKFTKDFQLIEGYKGLGPDARVVGNKSENKRKYLEAIDNLTLEIDRTSQEFNVPITQIVTPGEPSQPFKLVKINDTKKGKSLIFEEAYGRF